VEIFWLDEVDSTQRFLLDALKYEKVNAPIAVGATLQTNGKGSRGNTWIGEEGNFFFSFAYLKNELPNDLKLESASIYFSYLMKDLLQSLGSSVWLKWPNDFYIENRKIGGLITNLREDILVCGIGINLAKAPDEFSHLDIKIDPKELAKLYIGLFEMLPNWKQIFSNFKIEFERSRTFFTHYNNLEIPMEKAVLCEDGSLMCEGQRIFSLR